MTRFLTSIALVASSAAAFAQAPAQETAKSLVSIYGVWRTAVMRKDVSA